MHVTICLHRLQATHCLTSTYSYLFNSPGDPRGSQLSQISFSAKRGAGTFRTVCCVSFSPSKEFLSCKTIFPHQNNSSLINCRERTCSPRKQHRLMYLFMSLVTHQQCIECLFCVKPHRNTLKQEDKGTFWSSQ
jgi:hypothetical protein